MPIPRNQSCVPAQAPHQAQAPHRAQHAPHQEVTDDEYRRLATIRHRNAQALQPDALRSARNALHDALHALHDVQRATYADMDAALAFRPRPATEDDRLDVEILLPNPDPARAALHTITRFLGDLTERVDAIDHRDPVHMLIVPRPRMAAHVERVHNIPPARFNSFRRDWHPDTHDHRTGDRRPRQLCPILSEPQFTPAGSWIIHDEPILSAIVPAIPIATGESNTISDASDSSSSSAPRVRTTWVRRTRTAGFTSPSADPDADADAAAAARPLRRRRLFRAASSSSTERYAEPTSEPNSEPDYPASPSTRRS